MLRTAGRQAENQHDGSERDVVAWTGRIALPLAPRRVQIDPLPVRVAGRTRLDGPTRRAATTRAAGPGGT
jgi:hypothetical protein